MHLESFEWHMHMYWYALAFMFDVAGCGGRFRQATWPALRLQVHQRTSSRMAANCAGIVKLDALLQMNLAALGPWGGQSRQDTA